MGPSARNARVVSVGLLLAATSGFAQAALVRSQNDGAISPAQVAAVKVPTLGIVGSLDGYFADFQDLKKLRPDVRLGVIDGATHTGARGALRRPEFITAVRDFIGAHRTTSLGTGATTARSRLSAPDAADYCRTGLALGDTARFVGNYRNYRAGARTLGEIRIWREGANRIRFTETFDGTPAFGWDGEIDIAPDATWQRFVLRTLGDGTVRNTQSAERIGDSVITMRDGARTVERLPAGALRLPRSISSPAFAILSQCARARGRDGFPTVSRFGLVRVTKGITTNVRASGRTKSLSLYAVSSDSVPDLDHLWLDAQGRLFAAPNAGIGYALPPDWAPAIEPLLLAEAGAAGRRMRQSAAALAVKPAAGIVFAHARLLDVEHGTTFENMSVVVRGARIVAVGPDSAIKRPARAIVVDATGKTLMPGLWDFNPGYHTSSFGAIYDDGWRGLLSRGITSIYEIHGDTTFAPLIVQRLERGDQIGPRLLTTCAIFGWVPDLIDGAVSRFRDSPNQVRNRDELRRVIARCAAQGRKWVNTYSTFPPELISAAIEETEARGLRFMNTSSSRGGATRGVQTHIAQALFAIVSADTNWTDWQLGRVGGAAQFWAYGRAVPDLDLNSPRVRAVVERFAGGRVAAGTSLCVYPPTNRNMRAHDTTWDAATSKKLMEFVGLVHRAGATLLPGTEGACSLSRELQLLSQTGISNADLLSSATLGAARFAELDHEVGSITVGKRADIILVDGDPLARLEDLDKVTMVMRDGTLFRDLRALRAPLPFLQRPARE